MKVKLTPDYVIVIINGTDFYFDRDIIDEKGFLNYDGWGINVEGKPHILVKSEEDDDEDEEEFDIA